MSDQDSRYDEVEAHILDVVDRFGNENHLRMISTCLQDISVTLALILDGTSEANTSPESETT